VLNNSGNFIRADTDSRAGACGARAGVWAGDDAGAGASRISDWAGDAVSAASRAGEEWAAEIRDQKVGGRKRRVYTITGAGKKALAKAGEKVDELYEELHEERPRGWRLKRTAQRNNARS